MSYEISIKTCPCLRLVCIERLKLQKNTNYGYHPAAYVNVACFVAIDYTSIIVGGGGIGGGNHGILVIIIISGITASDSVSDDKCDKNNCPLLLAENIASDTTKQEFGHDSTVRIFPDSKSNIRLFRVAHADFKNAYETEIVGENLHCSLGLVDVFLQDPCVGTGNHRRSYKECVHGGIDTEANGTIRCTYRCYPIYNSNTTFVRFAKVNYITADYSAWALKAILTHDIN